MRPCPYCGGLMHNHAQIPKRPKGFPRPEWRKQHGQRLATRDHIVPKSRGGGGQRTVKVCHFCNVEKSARTLDEYRVLRFNRYGQRFFYYERRIPELISKLVWAKVGPVLLRAF